MYLKYYHKNKSGTFLIDTGAYSYIVDMIYSTITAK